MKVHTRNLAHPAPVGARWQPCNSAAKSAKISGLKAISSRVECSKRSSTVSASCSCAERTPASHRPRASAASRSCGSFTPSNTAAAPTCRAARASPARQLRKSSRAAPVGATATTPEPSTARARAVDAVSSLIEVEVVTVQAVEERRDHDRERALVVEPIGERAPEARLGTLRLRVGLAEAGEHAQLAAVLQRHAANVDGVGVRVLTHQREARHLAAVVGPALLDAHHALTEVALGFFVQ